MEYCYHTHGKSVKMAGVDGTAFIDKKCPMFTLNK